MLHIEHDGAVTGVTSGGFFLLGRLSGLPPRLIAAPIKRSARLWFTRRHGMPNKIKGDGGASHGQAG
jgi:hypothetical protein